MRTLLVAASTALAVAGVVAVSGTAFALNGNGGGQSNGYERQLADKAQVLQMSTEQLRTELKTKTYYDLAKEKGIDTATWHAAVAEKAQNRWQANGLDQATIQERTQAMQERQADCDGTGTHAGGGMRNGRQ